MYYIMIAKMCEIYWDTTHKKSTESAGIYQAFICKCGCTETQLIASIRKINTHKWEIEYTDGHRKYKKSLKDAINAIEMKYTYLHEMKNVYNK